MYKYIDYSKPPFIDISLPPAFVIPKIALFALYTFILGLDLYFLYHEQQFRKDISAKQLRIGMAIVHIMIPMLFVGGYPPLDLLFAAVPWFLASYSAHIPTNQLNIFEYIHTISSVIINDDEISNNKTKVRCKGLSKLSLGVIKIALMHIIVNPLLPRRPEYALDYAWFSLQSLTYTALFGLKAYLLLGVLEIYMSLIQIVLGWNMVDLFDSPIIASSPRDFWSRRWNRIVRNLLHTQVFTRSKSQDDNDDDLQSLAKPNQPSVIKKSITTTKKKSIKKTTTTTTTTTITRRVTRSSAKASNEAPIELIDDTNLHILDTPVKPQEDEKVKNDVIEATKDTKKKPKSFWSTRQGRGLLSFIISGLFHELIIMSVCRKITLENFAFFTLHGLAVAIEVELRQGVLKQQPQGLTRVLCVVIQFIFMSVTGRLFTGPFLRYNFFQVE